MPILFCKANNLYYCETNACVLENTPEGVRTAHVDKMCVGEMVHKLKHPMPTSKAKKLEAELWKARFFFVLGDVISKFFTSSMYIEVELMIRMAS